MLKNKYGVKITPIDKKYASSYAFELSQNMRKEDKDECKAMGKQPRNITLQSIMNSQEVYAARHKNALLCIFGMAGNVIWCLGTETIKKHSKALILIGYSFIKDSLKTYSIVRNCISKKNIPAIRYIEGYKEADLYEGDVIINGEPFLYFELRRKDHV